MKKDKYVSYSFEEYCGDYPPENAVACVAWFQQVLEDIPEPYRAQASIEVGSVTSYDSHNGEIRVSYWRPETDEEEAEREAKERDEAERRRQNELRQLAELQAKYGTVTGT